MALTDFSDDEDLHLFQIAKMFTDAGCKIDWMYVARKMKYSKKTKEQLRGRLKTLKQRLGVDLSKFPRRFVTAPKFRRKKYCAKKKNQPSKAGISSNDAVVSSCLLHVVNQIFQNVPEVLMTPCLTAEDTLRVVAEMFQSVPKSLVNQPANAIHHNVGEVLPVTITELINFLKISPGDVFVDIGSGIGNILAQIAVQTNAKMCIGVEVRGDVMRYGEKLIQTYSKLYPALKKIRLIPGKFEDADFQLNDDLKQATILYSLDKLFEVSSLLRLQVLVCDIPTLQYVVVSVHPCPRHRKNCTREFCCLWEEAMILPCETSYGSSKEVLFIYKRRKLA